MSDISKIINNSIKSVINESDETVEAIKKGAKRAVETIKSKAKEIQDDMSTGKAAEIVYDKLHPEKPDVAFELAKKLNKVNRELAAEKNLGIGEHLTKAGTKALAKAKETSQDVVDKIKEHPGLAAATAAALAAGAGGLAAVKKMRKAAKK